MKMTLLNTKKKNMLNLNITGKNNKNNKYGGMKETFFLSHQCFCETPDSSCGDNKDRQQNM
jgi:hypothetical protein